MRKMYFAMIPKRSFLESAVIALGVGAGVVYGAKFLLGEEQYSKYKAKLKDIIFNSNVPEFKTSSVETVGGMGPDTGVGIDEDISKAHEEDSILARIRAAAKL